MYKLCKSTSVQSTCRGPGCGWTLAGDPNLVASMPLPYDDVASAAPTIQGTTDGPRPRAVSTRVLIASINYRAGHGQYETRGLI